MNIGDRIRGSADEEITIEDIDELLDRIKTAEPNVYAPSRMLGMATEQNPELVQRRTHRIPEILEQNPPELVKRSLYRILHETDERSPAVLLSLVQAAPEDLWRTTASTRVILYELLERAASEGVDIPEEVFDTFVRGIAATPDETPFVAAMDAYIEIVLQQDSIGNRGFTPLIDFIESNYPKLRREAVRALVEIVLNGTIDSTANVRGVQMVLESQLEAPDVAVDKLREAINRL
jgi:hypothetical protein